MVREEGSQKRAHTRSHGNLTDPSENSRIIYGD